ncbi:MAG: zinc-dependent metalloprotease [Longimicrobiales bacterium]
MLSAQGTLLRAAMAARGDVGPGDPVPLEYVGEALRWVVMHEVGHTLGLRHNFRSSIDTPLEQLHDRDWARTRGLVSSVMDYHSPNIAARGERQGYYYTPTVGSSDEWVIAYGYTSDAARAAAIAREAGSDGHAFGTDEDAGGSGALDPTVNPNDLGADPLRWARQRAGIIAALWPDLPAHVLTDNSRYADLTDAFQTLVGQYAQALAPAVKYVGGQYVYRTRPGDANDRGPFVAVPKARQLEALSFLTERAFSEDAFAVPPRVLAQFGPDRWNHWGASNTFSGRIDYPLHERVLAVQTTLLNQLTNPFRLARIRDAELKFGAAEVVTIPELMDELTRAVWSEVWGATSRNMPAMRRDLQRAYLDRMTEIVATRQERMPADARAVARLRLSDLDRRIAQRLESAGSLDAYTVAHLQEARARIDKALDAGIELEIGT